MFDLLIQLVTLLALTLYFFVNFFGSLNKILSPIYFGRFFIGIVTLFLVVQGKHSFNTPVQLFKLVVCLPIGSLNFLVFFSLWKIISKFIGKISVFLRNFTDF